jgi:hypothetical protein
MLELRPPIVGRGGTGLDITSGDIVDSGWEGGLGNIDANDPKADGAR